MSVNIHVFLVYSVYDLFPNMPACSPPSILIRISAACLPIPSNKSSFVVSLGYIHKKAPAENIPQVPRVYIRITVLYLKSGHRIMQQISHLIQILGITVNTFHDGAHLCG